MKKTIKTVVTATMIAVSGGMMLGTYTTTAVAAETAAGVNQAISDLKKLLAEAIEIAAAGTDQEALKAKIYEARQVNKEITGDQYGARLQRLSQRLRVANGMAKRGDMAGAEEKLKEALKILNTFERS